MIFKVTFKVVVALNGDHTKQEVLDWGKEERFTTITGVRVAETIDVLVIAQAVTTDGYYTNPVRIPQSLITEVEVIDE